MFGSLPPPPYIPNSENELRRFIAEREAEHRDAMAPYYQRLAAYESMQPRAPYVTDGKEIAPGLFGSLFGGGLLG